MARINISEFQFVFAFFHKFMSLPENQGKSFVVPSLLQEGGIGNQNPDLAGTDLIIEDEFFFQFKVGDRMKQACTQTRNGQLDATFLPFFRFNIKNSPQSRQFNTLVNLASRKGGERVYYIAPKFSYPHAVTADDEAFNDFWGSNAEDAINKVVWIDFHQWVGRNPYDVPAEHHDNHVICYNQNSVAHGYGYMFSEKKEFVVSSLNTKEYKLRNENKDVNEAILEIANILKGSILDEVRQEQIDRVFDEGQNSAIKLIKDIQKLMLVDFDILWTPIISKAK
jgi:hypothetical protein